MDASWTNAEPLPSLGIDRILNTTGQSMNPHPTKSVKTTPKNEVKMHPTNSCEQMKPNLWINSVRDGYILIVIKSNKIMLKLFFNPLKIDGKSRSRNRLWGRNPWIRILQDVSVCTFLYNAFPSVSLSDHQPCLQSPPPKWFETKEVKKKQIMLKLIHSLITFKLNEHILISTVPKK